MQVIGFAMMMPPPSDAMRFPDLVCTKQAEDQEDASDRGHPMGNQRTDGVISHRRKDPGSRGGYTDRRVAHRGPLGRERNLKGAYIPGDGAGATLSWAFALRDGPTQRMLPERLN